MTTSSTVIALIVFGLLVTAYACLTMAMDKYGRHRLMRKLRCLVGDHGLDTIKEEGDFLVQRCLYCEKVAVRLENKDQTIRRVQ